MKSLFSLTAGVIALGAASSPALAANRTFVSGTGTDAGACAITSPCRTFAYALAQTAASGEVIVLSSGGYGTATITQAVSIINVGYYAGVTVASGNGITINAGTSDSVTLRGISVDGGGTGSNGIVFNSGGKLTIDQCNVQNFAGHSATAGNGIVIQPTSGNQNITITNTTASNNQQYGVEHQQSGNAVSGIVIDHVIASNNTIGIVLSASNGGTASASVSNSIASGNHSGYYFGNVANASLDSSYASGNPTSGVYVSASTLALGRSVLMNNGTGLIIDVGTVNSYQDNRIAGNNTQVTGTITPVSPQ